MAEQVCAIILNSRKVTVDYFATDQVLKEAVHALLGTQLQKFSCNTEASMFKSRETKLEKRCTYEFCILVM
jgi:hypothetical protein